MKKKVLVVDDELPVLLFLRRGLEKLGFICLEASTAKIGLDILAKEEVDLVLTDRQLHDGSEEFALVKASKQAKPERPVVVMSGNHGEGIAEAVLAAGADAFLPKPFDMEALRSLFQKYLPVVRAGEVIQYVEELQPNPDRTDWDQYSVLLTALNLSVHRDAGTGRETAIPPETVLGEESLRLFNEFKAFAEQKHPAHAARA